MLLERDECRKHQVPIILPWLPLRQLHEFSGKPEPPAIARHDQDRQKKRRIAELEGFDFGKRLNAAWLKTHRRWKSCISHFGQIKVAPPASNSRKNWKAPVSERSHSKAALPAYRWLEASWRRRNKKTFRTWRICKQAAAHLFWSCNAKQLKIKNVKKFNSWWKMKDFYVIISAKSKNFKKCDILLEMEHSS